MYDIFISTEFKSVLDLILETLGLIAISTVIIWLILLLGFNKKKKSKLSIKVRLKLNYLLALGILSVLFSIYFTVLYWFNGTHCFTWLEFPWDTTNLYLRILPQIILFFTIIIVFFYNYSKMTKLLKK
jgi:hypothetical protein